MRTQAKRGWNVAGLMMLLALTLASGAAAQDSIIGVGMAFDDQDIVGPARIAFLYDDVNSEILAPGDMILEYRGYPVGSGSELYQLILDLPDVEPGELVPMVIGNDDGEVTEVAPIAVKLEAKTSDHTFADRQCDDDNGNCLCSKEKKGSTCVRTITTEVDPATGKVVKTSSSCVDGLNICPPVPKPKKKGK